jgi:hypothetical protein
LSFVTNLNMDCWKSKKLDENISSTKTLFAPNIVNLGAHATLMKQHGLSKKFIGKKVKPS